MIANAAMKIYPAMKLKRSAQTKTILYWKNQVKRSTCTTQKSQDVRLATK
jgi:hypothetical protein